MAAADMPNIANQLVSASEIDEDLDKVLAAAQLIVHPLRHMIE